MEISDLLIEFSIIFGGLAGIIEIMVRPIRKCIKRIESNNTKHQDESRKLDERFFKLEEDFKNLKENFDSRD